MVDDKVWTISKNEADRNWMTQVLTGDKVDNVDGCQALAPRLLTKSWAQP